MYEFIDGDGGRVTIRSARTLGQLLASGRITAATRFRLAGEAEFGPAGEHAALLEIASQVGVRFAAPIQPAAVPPIAAPPPPASPPPRPVPPKGADRPPAPAVTKSPWRSSVPPTGAPAVSRRVVGPAAPRPRARAAPGQAFVVLVCLLGALVLGLLAGAVAGGVSKSATVGWLVTVAGAAWGARLAGRRLVSRTPPVTPLQVGMGSAVFLAGCLLAGWSGAIVGLPCCAALWDASGKRGRRGRAA